MLSLSAKARQTLLGKKQVRTLREKGILPAILYGPEIKPISLEVNLKEFEKIYQKARESSLISLKVDQKKFSVLIQEVARDPLTSRPIHVDFYQPRLEEEVEVTVPIIFEGEAPAVKNLGGTLVKNISQLEVKALPRKLPQEIRVDISRLKSFEDNILVKDLQPAEGGVKISRAPEEILAFVAPPEKIEEELAKPIEEKVEEVEKVEKEKKEEEEEAT